MLVRTHGETDSTAWAGFARACDNRRDTHNLLLEVLTTSGIVGTTFFSSALDYAAGRLARPHRPRGHPAARDVRGNVRRKHERKFPGGSKLYWVSAGVRSCERGTCAAWPARRRHPARVGSVPGACGGRTTSSGRNRSRRRFPALKRQEQRVAVCTKSVTSEHGGCIPRPRTAARSTARGHRFVAPGPATRSRITNFRAGES